jgi:hypothetical protein
LRIGHCNYSFPSRKQEVYSIVLIRMVARPKSIPCMKHEDKLDLTDVSMVKIEGPNNRTRKVPVFAPAMKVEGLFYVYDSFEKAACRLQFAVADYWDQFEDVLDIGARSKWSNLIIGIADNQRTCARFLACVSTLIQMYAENTKPRDIMFAYLRTEIRKPRNADPGAHASRVETLCRLSNRLQGTEAELTEIQIRKLVFETFPSIWQT